MVVPPDFHDDQRLITHKLRVSGSNVDTERSYDTFGNVVLDLTLERVDREVEFTSWIVVEREAGADGAHYSEPLAPDARFSEPSRLTRPDDGAHGGCGRAPGEPARPGSSWRSSISTRVHDHLRYDWEATSIATTAAEAWAGGAGVCQDYAHCMLALARLCGLSARYVSGHLLGEGGSHAWVEILVPHPQHPELRLGRSLRSDARPARRAPVRHRRRRPRLRRRRPHLRHLRRRVRRPADDEQAGRGHERRIPPAAPPPDRRAPLLLAAEQRLQPGQVALAEGGQAVVLDLVDENGVPRSVSQSSNAPGQWPTNWSCQGRPAERASASVTPGGTAPRTKMSSSGLWRSTTSGGSRRSIRADQRPGLGLRAGMRSRRRAVRPVREDPDLGIDPRGKGEGRVRLPGRRREVAVEVDAGRVLPRAGEQAVRIEHRNHRPARLGAGNPLQQPAHEQGGVRFLAVLAGGQQARERSVALRHEHPQRQVASRAAVLLDPPAVELAAEPLAHWTAIRTATSSVSSAVPLKTPRVGGTSA